MGSDLYEVRVASREGATVTLDVAIVHPDAGGVLADPSFALMMLRDTADDDDVLAQELSYDDVLDSKWMKKYARGFILSVTGGSRGKKPTKGSLTITVSHPLWVKHLKKGKSYDSRAFQNATTYRAAAPILPESAKAPAKKAANAPKAPKASNAAATKEIDPGSFIWVPKQLFAEYLDGLPAPELLEMPAYGDKSYVPVETLAPSAGLEKLLAWSGRAVEHRGSLGALVVSSSGAAKMFRYGHGSRSAGGVDPTRETFSSITLRKGARLNTKLSYVHVLDAMPGVITGSVVDGNVATLTLEHGPKSASTIQSATDVLWLLARTLPGFDTYDLKGDEPLAKQLLHDATLEGTRTQWQEVLRFVASTYIRRFELAPVPTAKIPRLDAMTPEKVRDFFLSHPFGVGTLVVEVSDPAFLAHLSPTLYVPLLTYPRQPPAPMPPRPVYGPLDRRTVDWELLGLRVDEKRVLREIRAGWPGASTNLNVGVVVTQVNGEPLSTRASFEDALIRWASEGARGVEIVSSHGSYSVGTRIALRAPTA